MKIVFEDDDGNRSERIADIINLKEDDRVLIAFKEPYPLSPEQCDILKERWAELFSQPLLVLNRESEIIISRQTGGI